MPLVVATLTQEILKLTDKTRSDFKGFPMVLTPAGAIDVAGTNNKVATNWSVAAQVFFSTIVVPPVLPPVVAAGAAAFKSSMFGLLGPPGSPTAAAALAAGFTAFAAIIASGATIPVAIPPPAPLIIPIGPPILDPTIPAANIAAAVFAWAITGTYGVPPAPPSIPWS
jgi:hypothetical protein